MTAGCPDPILPPGTPVGDARVRFTLRWHVACRHEVGRVDARHDLDACLECSRSTNRSKTATDSKRPHSEKWGLTCVFVGGGGRI